MDVWNKDVEGDLTLQLINSDDTTIRVEAGPGTGKTYGLVRRVQRILHPDGLSTPGADVLIVAFNRVIARALAKDVEECLEHSPHDGDPVILQEILADRWAAFAYGAKQFEQGLRHVIARSIRFDAHASATLNEVIDGQKPLANLYAYRPSEALDEVQVVNTVSEAINAMPSPYDSHPSPRHRFEWVHGLEAKPTGNLSDAEEDAWALFADRALLEQWMTERVRDNLQEAHGVRIATDL